MSRQRISAKVRTNADYQAIGAMLDGLGLRWSVHPPTGKGHPFLLIESPQEGGEPSRYPISCSPRGYSSTAAKVARLRRHLRIVGFIADTP